MPIDADQIKNDVDIVDIISKFVTLKKEGSGYKGCCPFHDEKTGSFNVMPDRQRYFCHGCQEQGDVIDFIKKHKSLDFKAACEFLGGDIKPDQPPAPRPAAKKKKHAKPVPLNYEDAKNHYTKDIMQDRADFIFKDNPKTLKKAWPYKNDKGEVELVAVRFEDGKGNKTVLSMYWNGKTIKLKDYPVLLYNRDRLKAEQGKDCLIVFGEKCAAIADDLGFVGVTWNGGEKKVKDVDLSPLKNRTIYLWPDDDKPGRETAEFIIKALPHVQVVKIIPELREIEPKGADIAEAMIHFNGDIEAVKNHIYKNSERIAKPEPDEPATTPEAIKEIGETVYPFKILGIADDGRAYIIGSNERLYPFNTMSFTKAQLYNLADLEYWQTAYSHLGSGGKMWDQAISDLVQIVNCTDFDSEIMRGRGAWQEQDGRLCYHDGRKTTGDYSKERVYLRRIEMKIGINGKHATKKERDLVREIADKLTFTTKADCVRTLGWAVLSPFAGALPWRPAGLLSAASGTGKSTIVDYIVKPLSAPIICSGGESTAAGIRQKAGVDSRAIVVEEAETDTQKKKQNRDDTFSLMRQSTSDNSPDVLKGTIDGKGISFKLRSMFFFVSISPEVECEADENRIFRISLSQPKDTRAEWVAKKKKLEQLLSPSVCSGIRAYTWSHLKEIITLAERVATQAQLVAGADNRTAFAESLLLAAYMAVFKDNPDPSDDYINEFVKLFYTLGVPEKRRNENEEMVDLLLDAIVKGDSGHNYTIREVLGAIETGYIYSEEVDTGSGHIEDQKQPMDTTYARRLAGMYGCGLHHGDIAIAKNHPEVMKILNKGKGYQLQLMRHPRLVERGKNVNLGSSAGVKNCVVIGRENEYGV